MQFKQLVADEDAVSPVIGVILMVAITVILAAVIGTFVLGLGDQVSSSAPQASFTFDFNDGGNDNLTITHDGGDSIANSKLSVSSDSSFCAGDGNDTGTCPDTGGSVTSLGMDATVQGSPWVSGDVNAGTSVKIVGDSDLSSATVRVVWSSENGDSTQTLAKFEGPDA